MTKWLHLTLVAISAAVLVFILLLILKRCFRTRKPQNFDVSDAERSQNLQNGIARLHQVSPHNHHVDRNNSNKTNYYLFKRGTSARPVFSWADHPSLVTDAVENGWSRFAFTNFTSSPSVKSASLLLGACGSGDTNEPNVEIGWEVSEGSADFMQKIRLNPNLKNTIKNPSSSMGAFSAIRTALPLPGPNLGNSSFPQEAYFEIKILDSNENGDDLSEKKGKSEGDKIKLIGEDFNAKNSPVSLDHVKSSHSQRRTKLEEMKIGGKTEVISISVGLTGGGPLPLKIPGSYQGSIGFNSSGSVYLNGLEHHFACTLDG
ncbi:hypothetical protein CDL12_17531 [Handroanthus impetiginosus]|uniref:Uncharacterized protein n=1 Tax=Handroanthus impetiginosus TaxID=429701 RepID=A0A2G9GX78_9LAMI|nr:hypothetical protein CDL12_17531 [Handroanthus impetiginosus]